MNDFFTIQPFHKHLWRAVGSIALTTFCACSSLTPHRTAIPLVGNDVPTEWLLPLTSDAENTAGWGALYNDPILQNYLVQAKTANYDIRIAQTRIISAQADLRRSAARLKPRFEVNTSAAVTALLSDVENPFDSYGLGVSGRWDPDVFGQTKTIIEGSRAALAVQEALSADTYQAVLATTARAYIRAVEAKLQVKLAKDNLDFLTESRRISEARFRLGDTAKGDFSFAEANYQSALASYETTRQSADAAKRALSILLGGYPEQNIQLADTLGTPKSLPSRNLPATLLELRPDIVAARAQMAARLASLNGEQLGRWPVISISGDLSSGSNLSDLFDPSDYIARLGASLAQTIFDSGAIDASIDSSKAALEETVLTYEQSLRRAMGEITDAYDRAESLRRALINLEASSESANEALRLESVQFDLGESSLLDVLQVQSRVNNIDASLIRTKAALIETTITANEAITGFGNSGQQLK